MQVSRAFLALRPLGILCLLVCLGACGRTGEPVATWAGDWDTRWQDGGARLELRQTGLEVSGRYPSYAGLIEGRVDGSILRGRWKRGAQSGPLEFVMAPDGRSFVGRYNAGEWWTGGRVETHETDAVSLAQDTPRETLRSFLGAGNAARHNAPDLYARAAGLIDFGPDPTAVPPEQKIDRARSLFMLIDQTTFRLSALPDPAPGSETHTVKMPQAGTDAALALDFVLRDGRWFIREADDAAMQTARRALLVRANGHPPLPDDFRRRRNPRDAMRAFERAFYAWDRDGAQRARATLDLSHIPEAVRDYAGDLAAQYLNGILNRVGVVEPQEIPDDPASTEPYVLFSHPAGRVVIAPGAADSGWAFTAETVASARDLFIVMEDMPPRAGRKLPTPPSVYFEIRHRIRGLAPVMLTQFETLELWQIIGWALVLAVACAAGYLAMRLLLGALCRVLGGAEPGRLRRDLRWPLWGTLGLSLYKLIIPALGLPEGAKQISVGATGTALALSLTWLSWVLLDALANRYFVRAEGRFVTIDNILVSLAFGLFKLLALALGLSFVAVELSLPYEGVIASLSIGGLAVAFASRETLSNVFGAGILAIDRPFRRGDWIATGDTKGTVEHVGIRSTRVRTADDSLIIVPNGKLSDATVNNLGTRRFHLNSAKLPLPYATSVPQIEALVSGVKDLVAEIPESTPERTSVSVSALSQDGIEVTLKYGLDVRNGANETEIVNRLMMNILRLCERLGIRNGGAMQAA